MMDILWAAVGFVICAVLFSLMCILMIVVWWMFKTNQDIEIETEDWEEENESNGRDCRSTTSDDADFVDRNGKYYWEHELFFGSRDVSSYDDPDYWTRLEHQYAGMAMQGIFSSDIIMEKINRINAEGDKFGVLIAELSANLAHALVEKMKEVRK